MIPLLLLATWQMASGLTVVAPPYPSNALHGSNVVAVIGPSRELENHVDIIHGEEPFVSVVREALQQWRLPGNRSALVVVNFRDLDIDIVRFGYDEIEYIPHREHFGWPSPHSMPLPVFVVDPLYPDVYAPKASSVLPGAFVLHLEIDTTGTVRDAQVLTSKVAQGIDDFQSAAIEAVSQWRFAPPQDESAKAISSDAYAICVYRPLTEMHRDPQKRKYGNIRYLPDYAGKYLLSNHQSIGDSLYLRKANTMCGGGFSECGKAEPTRNSAGSKIYSG